MSKFILPTQKGSELFPSTMAAPPVVRWVGVDARSPEAQGVMAQYGSALAAFYVQQSQNYALSGNTQARAERQLGPDLGVTYVNQGGIEYVTLRVKLPELAQVSEPKKTVEEKLEEKYLQPEIPEATGKCLMVLYSRNKIAAIPMSQLGTANFATVYRKTLSNSSWTGKTVCAQYRFSSNYSGAWMGRLKFTETTITDYTTDIVFDIFYEGRYALTEPANPSGYVDTLIPYDFDLTDFDHTYAYGFLPPTMSGSGDKVYTPYSSFTYEAEGFKLSRDRQPDLTSGGFTAWPVTLTPDGVMYLSPKVTQGGFEGDGSNPSVGAVPSLINADMSAAIDDNYYYYMNLPDPVRFIYYQLFRAGQNQAPQWIGDHVFGPPNSVRNSTPFEHSVVKLIPTHSYDKATGLAQPVWVPVSVEWSGEIVPFGSSGATTVVTTYAYKCLGLSYGQRTGSQDESDYVFGTTPSLKSFLPAMGSAPYADYVTDAGETRVLTPHGAFSGDFFPRMHISNGKHVIQMFSVVPESVWSGGNYAASTASNSKLGIYLNGVDVSSLITASLGVEYHDIDAMMMDVPLAVIKKFT